MTLFLSSHSLLSSQHLQHWATDRAVRLHLHPQLPLQLPPPGHVRHHHPRASLTEVDAAHHRHGAGVSRHGGLPGLPLLQRQAEVHHRVRQQEQQHLQDAQQLPARRAAEHQRRQKQGILAIL